jgi:predicted TIM-barrel fold metal-dependent hydrolase
MGGKIETEKQNVQDADSLHEKVCVEFDIDHPLINAFPVLNSVPEDDRAVELMYAYNDYLIENYLDKYDEFLGLCTVAVQDPEVAAEEIDRMANETSIEGVYLLDSGAQPPLGDSVYDVMYQAAEDNGLHIAYHASAGAPFAKDFPIQDNQFNRFLENHMLAHPWAHMMTMTSLIVNGTPEKFPDLNFSFLEAGVGWVPYMMSRLNKEYSMRRSEAPLLNKSPEEYIRDQFYFSTQPVGEPNDPEHLSQIIEVLGPESLMLSTDYPHWDFDHPDAIDQQVRRISDEETRSRILSKTAVEAFDLSI